MAPVVLLPGGKLSVATRNARPPATTAAAAANKARRFLLIGLSFHGDLVTAHPPLFELDVEATRDRRETAERIPISRMTCCSNAAGTRASSKRACDSR